MRAKKTVLLENINRYNCTDTTDGQACNKESIHKYKFKVRACGASLPFIIVKCNAWNLQ